MIKVYKTQAGVERARARQVSLVSCADVLSGAVVFDVVSYPHPMGGWCLRRSVRGFKPTYLNTRLSFGDLTQGKRARRAALDRRIEPQTRTEPAKPAPLDRLPLSLGAAGIGVCSQSGAACLDLQGVLPQRAHRDNLVLSIEQKSRCSCGDSLALGAASSVLLLLVGCGAGGVVPDIVKGDIVSPCLKRKVG